MLLTQMPSGAFSFDPSPAGVLAAQRVLDAGPASFKLAPGASRRVDLRWRGLPANARTANVGVIYQATPPAEPAPVRIVEQLLGVNILRLPGHYRLTGQLTGVHVAQVKPGTLRFTLSIDNTGQAVVGPSRLVLTIRDQYGALLLNKRLPTDIVLPGATRDFTLNVKHQLPAGRYTVRGHAAFGSSHRLAAIDNFELVGPNELPTSEVQIGPLIGKGAIGESAQVDATLKNIGTEAGNTAVDVSLYRLIDGVPGQIPVATRHIVTESVAPGKTRGLSSDIGRLRTGTYRLVASYYDSNGIPQTLISDFQAQQQLGILAQLRSFDSEHLLLIPSLLLLMGGGSIGLLLIRERHLKSALAAAERRVRRYD
ncbi:MAG TPA: hypothetical protein VHS55_08015 [Solirubrobacteraceae bacterium]|nr:hypothetical protein [Solirubrobacteraceae bacterium]